LRLSVPTDEARYSPQSVEKNTAALYHKRPIKKLGRGNNPSLREHVLMKNIVLNLCAWLVLPVTFWVIVLFIIVAFL
jgi:hypothetical protein